MKKGYIQVYTGNGKGKTTAALGLTIRAAGAGLKVYFVQFLKGRKSSENIFLEKFKDQITMRQFGKNTFLKGEPTSDDVLRAKKGFQVAQIAISSGKYNLVVLDEVFFAINLKLIKLDDVIMLLKTKPCSVEIVMTGRNCPLKIIEIADLTTEMKEIKHYFKSGIKARLGIEF
jgi:cob(I)alamin adenosyltransferase